MALLRVVGFQGAETDEWVSSARITEVTLERRHLNGGDRDGGTWIVTAVADGREFNVHHAATKAEAEAWMHETIGNA